MAKRDQGYMRRLRDGQPDVRRVSHREEHESRKATLFLSVAGMMALVVTLWVVVMPVQLAGLKLGSAKQTATSQAGEKSAGEQWDELISGSSARLQQVSDAIGAREKIAAQATASAPATTAAPIDAAALTAKLQAASSVSSAPTSR